MTQKRINTDSEPRQVKLAEWRDLSDGALAAQLDLAGEALASGDLVAFPTETVYGLGANALDARAVRRIFKAKERPAGHPLIVHVATVEMARRCAATWGAIPARLAEVFWPGPLTLIVPRSDSIPGAVTGGLETVGCRLPDHRVARSLIEVAGVPVAAPSANRHTEVSPTRAEHVRRSLGERVDWIVDAGSTTVGIESTVLDVTGDTLTILRPGAVQRSELVSALGAFSAAVEYAEHVEPPQQESRPSPGLAETHYAPEARLVLGRRAALSRRREALEAKSFGGRVGWVVMDASADATERFEARSDDVVIGMPVQPDEYAQQLYATLYRLDSEGCSVVFVEEPGENSGWRAVRDRLARAADERA